MDTHTHTACAPAAAAAAAAVALLVTAIAASAIAVAASTCVTHACTRACGVCARTTTHRPKMHRHLQRNAHHRVHAEHIGLCSV
jgi:hypothetical protein